MKVAFICQSVDPDDPILGFTSDWIRALASDSRVERLTVIALRAKRVALPGNVSVLRIRGRVRPVTLLRFYGVVVRLLLEGVDGFFIHMGGPYPILLYPLKLIGKPVYQWKNHRTIGPMMRFCARHCCTKIFTATRGSFPMVSPNVRVTGHGVDVDRFCPRAAERRKEIVTVGRIARSKRLDVILRIIAHHNALYETPCRLDLYGPVQENEKGHYRELMRMTEDLRLASHVSFEGPVLHDRMPHILADYRLFMNFSTTGLDKATLEAMACGLPVMSTNPCVGEILPGELKELLFVSDEDVAAQAERLHRLLSMGEDDLAHIGRSLREVVVRDHSLQRLFEKILGEMKAA